MVIFGFILKLMLESYHNLKCSRIMISTFNYHDIMMFLNANQSEIIVQNYPFNSVFKALINGEQVGVLVW